MNAQYYPFDIKSKRMLFSLDINAFFKLGNAFFQIHEMENGSIKGFWRKGFPNRKYIDHTIMIGQKYFPQKILSLNELLSTDEYKIEIAVISPVNRIFFSDEEIRSIIEMCNKGFPDNYKGISGRDGHSFELRFGDSKKYRLWCFIDESAEYIGKIINMLVTKAELDTKMYGVKILKR